MPGRPQERAAQIETAKRLLGVTPFHGDGPSNRVVRAVATDLGVADSYHPTDVGVYFGKPGQTVADPYFGGEGPGPSGHVRCGQGLLGCRYGAKNTLVKHYLHFAGRMCSRTSSFSAEPRAPHVTSNPHG